MGGRSGGKRDGRLTALGQAEGQSRWGYRLRRAGWSCGEFATASGWVVTATNGENILEATAPTQALAWRRAIEAALAVGMLW